MQKSNKECIICNQFKVPHFKNFDGWELVRCDNDGLIFVYPQPTEADLLKFYNSGQYFHSHNGKIGYKNYLKEKEMLMLNNKMILKVIKKSFNKLNPLGTLNNPPKLLDIGTAYGFFMEVACNEGFEVYGNDISEEAVLYAKNHDLNILLGSTKQNNHPSNFFDIVTMIGVIEHFNNPKEEIDEAVRILKPGGLLIILTLNTSNFIGRGAIKPPEHLYYFSAKNITRFLSLRGLNVIKIYPFFTFYRYEELLFHLLARLFKSHKYFTDKLERFLLNIVLMLRLNKLLDKMPIPVPDGQILVITRKGR